VVQFPICHESQHPKKIPREFILILSKGLNEKNPFVVSNEARNLSTTASGHIASNSVKEALNRWCKSA
jgi:hypothetical protein